MNWTIAVRAAAFLAGAVLLTGAASANPPGKPMVVRNPDGTITVQKEPVGGGATTAKAKKGLVIPAQVVTPMVLTPEKKR